MNIPEFVSSHFSDASARDIRILSDLGPLFSSVGGILSAYSADNPMVVSILDHAPSLKFALQTALKEINPALSANLKRWDHPMLDAAWTFLGEYGQLALAYSVAPSAISFLSGAAMASMPIAYQAGSQMVTSGIPSVFNGFKTALNWIKFKTAMLGSLVISRPGNANIAHSVIKELQSDGQTNTLSYAMVINSLHPSEESDYSSTEKKVPKLNENDLQIGEQIIHHPEQTAFISAATSSSGAAINENGVIVKRTPSRHRRRHNEGGGVLDFAVGAYENSKKRRRPTASSSSPKNKFNQSLLRRRSRVFVRRRDGK